MIKAKYLELAYRMIYGEITEVEAAEEQGMTVGALRWAMRRAGVNCATLRKQHIEQRNNKIIGLHRRDKTATEIGQLMDLSTSTVSRVIRDVKSTIPKTSNVAGTREPPSARRKQYVPSDSVRRSWRRAKEVYKDHTIKSLTP